MKIKITKCSHKDQPHYAHGVCHACYKSAHNKRASKLGKIREQVLEPAVRQFLEGKQESVTILQHALRALDSADKLEFDEKHSVKTHRTNLVSRLELATSDGPEGQR